VNGGGVATAEPEGGAKPREGGPSGTLKWQISTTTLYSVIVTQFSHLKNKLNQQIARGRPR